MLDILLFLKGLHVVGFVSWFAGLFYLGRLFVYHIEANDLDAPERAVLQRQYSIMQWRVYKIICNPGMMITLTAGIVMLILGITQPSIPNYLSPAHGTAGWMHLKLVFLVGLVAYHVWNKKVIKKLESDEQPFSSFTFRLMNEVPSLFLAGIAFTAVFGKIGRLNYGYLFIGLVAFAGLMYMGAKAYQRKRLGK